MNEKLIQCCYKPKAVLLISRFSDTAAIIKQENGDFVEYNGDTYSTCTLLSKSRMAVLFRTCGSILLFYHQVNIIIFCIHQSINCVGLANIPFILHKSFSKKLIPYVAESVAYRSILHMLFRFSYKQTIFNQICKLLLKPM